jgi:predicted dehydrogenase
MDSEVQEAGRRFTQAEIRQPQKGKKLRCRELKEKTMNNSQTNLSVRREFLKNTSRTAAISALAGAAIPKVYAAGSDLIQVALVGCGNRGTGAVAQALSTTSGPIKLVAMADVFEHKFANSINLWKKKYKVDAKVEVPEDRMFLGFNAYQQAMDCLKPGDVVILATPPAFRWVQFAYAIRKNLNVFMEKPLTVDGPTSRRMFQLGEESVRKNLKVGVGLMCRHCRGRMELFDRIQQGEIGDLILMRAYRMHGPVGSFASDPKPAGQSELMYQIDRFHSFLWASGGAFSDFYIHNIDECCWMKNAWPVKAQASGGRHYRGNSVDQNFDTYSVEYTFDDGAKLFLEGRCIDGAAKEHSSHAQGSKGCATISERGHQPSKAATYKGQNPSPAKQLWAFPQPEPDPKQCEWDDLIDAIRADKPFNEVKRGVEASLVTSMGRMAGHTGQIITYDQILNLDHEFAPGVDKLTMTSPAPLVADAHGRYPVPQPGIVTKREY